VIRSALVSVITPVFERAHCVMDAVQSVLDQTYPSVECLVVDDGSSDESFDVVARACQNEPRVRVFRQAQAGVSAARNRGLREARGEYVTFLDSDDLMPPTRIQRQLDLLSEREADGVLGTGLILAAPVPLPAWLEGRPSWQTGHCWISILTKARHLRDIGGFDPTLRIREDSDLLVRLRMAGVRIDAVDDTFVLRRFFGDNLTYDLTSGGLPFAPAIRRELARRRARLDV
jgi:glycosyltransferase involved in cell wall biosynthesis